MLWIERFVVWCSLSLQAASLIAAAVGAFSAVAPRRSIRLYQRIMAWCNWEVRPINAAHEVRMTAALGVLLVFLSALAFWRLHVITP